MSPELFGPLVAAGSFIAAWAIAELVRRNAGRLRLIQTPNERSSHTVPTPSGGGVGIAVAGTIAGFVSVQQDDSYVAWAIVTGAVAAFVGLIDDRFNLSSRLRIVIHFAIVGILLFALPQMPAIPSPFGNLPHPVLYTGLLVAGVWWINLFNFMDGIDGLAAGQAIFTLGSLVIIASTTSAAHLPSVTWMTAIAAACAGFLILNWSPARVFMGDAGSNYLAVSILAVGLYLIATGLIGYAVLPILTAGFCTDATITLARRALSGERWFAAHRLHAYQKLSRRWGSHRRTTLLYLAINMFWLYPLAHLATVFPQFSVLAIAGAVMPFACLCVWVGAGVPESGTVKT